MFFKYPLLSYSPIFLFNLFTLVLKSNELNFCFWVSLTGDSKLFLVALVDGFLLKTEGWDWRNC